MVTQSPIGIAIASLLGGGGIAAVIAGLFNRGKQRADITDQISTSAARWIERLETRNTVLEKRNAELETVVAVLRDELAETSAQLQRCRCAEPEETTL